MAEQDGNRGTCQFSDFLDLVSTTVSSGPFSNDDYAEYSERFNDILKKIIASNLVCRKLVLTWMACSTEEEILQVVHCHA